jgi:translation initiation factor IF-2
MSELNTPRLMAAAKEFNIGASTLIDFLVSKSLSGSDDLKPTSKLTEEMYRAAQGEYAQDKSAKEKADRVELIKTVAGDPKKKRDEQDLSFKKKDEKPKDVPKAPEAPKEEPAPPVQEKPEPAAPAPVEAPPVVKEEPVKEPVVEKVAEPVAEAPVVAAPAEPEVAGITKIEAPELEGPKILNKIDLSAIDSSTRPKKGAKKAEPAKTEAPKAVQPKAPAAKAPVAEVPKAPTPPPAEAPVAPVAEAPAAPVIENIQTARLTGPKILGKINLPVDNDTRPKRDDANKRKRIIIPKKPGATGNAPLPDNRGPRPGGEAAGN